FSSFHLLQFLHPSTETPPPSSFFPSSISFSFPLSPANTTPSSSSSSRRPASAQPSRQQVAAAATSSQADAASSTFFPAVAATPLSPPLVTVAARDRRHRRVGLVTTKEQSSISPQLRRRPLLLLTLGHDFSTRAAKRSNQRSPITATPHFSLARHSPRALCSPPPRARRCCSSQSRRRVFLRLCNPRRPTHPPPILPRTRRRWVSVVRNPKPFAFV
ncbi:hypothetical protein Tsubulata_022748, partial [Turnera subulata]